MRKQVPLFAVHMPRSVDEPLLDVLHSGYIGQGPKVEEFEVKLRRFLRSDNLVTLNNGTAGLHLALHLAGVGPDSEVVSTPMTCSASNTPILHTGTRIRWADIDPTTGNIDPDSVLRLMTNKTRAIVCVDWGGYPCDLDDLRDIAKAYGVPVIEDAAHAFGAEYKGRRVGSISDYTMFSLQAIKHINTIDGGVLCMRREDHLRRAKLLRWYGIDREEKRADLRCEADVAEAGFKYHMNDIAAVIGLEQMRHVDWILERHRANAAFILSEMKGRKVRRVRPLAYKKDRLSSYWLLTLLADDSHAFIKHMTAGGVQVSRVHSRNDTHSCFSAFREGELPGVDEFCCHQVSVPVHWALTSHDRWKIVNRIAEYERGGA